MRAGLLCISLFLLPAAAAAEEISREDALAIKAVVSEQLDAFKRDDAAKAFSLATAGIRAKFGTAEVFMDMVRSGYPVVYRPASLIFESPQIIQGEVFQPVRMTDSEGRAWIAVYPMQRQEDGTWRIDGCQLGRLPGRET